MSTNVVLYLNHQFTGGIDTQGPLFTLLKTRALTHSRSSWSLWPGGSWRCGWLC